MLLQEAGSPRSKGQQDWFLVGPPCPAYSCFSSSCGFTWSFFQIPPLHQDTRHVRVGAHPNDLLLTSYNLFKGPTPKYVTF